MIMRLLKRLEDSDCKIFSTHTHAQKKEGKLPYRESHLHFICQDRDLEIVVDHSNMLSVYIKKKKIPKRIKRCLFRTMKGIPGS